MGERKSKGKEEEERKRDTPEYKYVILKSYTIHYLWDLLYDGISDS